MANPGLIEIVRKPAAGGYATIKDEGIAQTQRVTVDFVGAGVTVSDVAGETRVSIPGGAGAGWTHFEQALGAAQSGTFTIVSSGLSANDHIDVMQTARAIVSRGNARDESEMDMISATGYVVDATTIRVYWHCKNRVIGTYAFAYNVNA